MKSGQLPLEAEAVISNVETLKNVILAIEERKPVITKNITLAGRIKDVHDGKVILNVPIGMPIINYIEQCGGYVQPHGEIAEI